MDLQPETVIEILWRRLRPFAAAASFDEMDGRSKLPPKKSVGWTDAL